MTLSINNYKDSLNVYSSKTRLSKIYYRFYPFFAVFIRVIWYSVLHRMFFGKINAT